MVLIIQSLIQYKLDELNMYTTQQMIKYSHMHSKRAWLWKYGFISFKSAVTSRWVQIVYLEIRNQQEVEAVSSAGQSTTIRNFTQPQHSYSSTQEWFNDPKTKQKPKDWPTVVPKQTKWTQRDDQNHLKLSIG